MKSKIEIKHWVTGSILFEFECDGNTILKTFSWAVNKSQPERCRPGGADLRSADLSGADLRSADLSGADLISADLAVPTCAMPS